MIKQILLILLLSILAIMFKSHLSNALDAIVGFHNLLTSKMDHIFSDDELGLLIQNMIALLGIPLLSGVIGTTGFWLVKRQAMPHLMGLVWMLWLVLVVTMIAQDGMLPNVAASKTRVSMHDARTLHRHVITAMQEKRITVGSNFR